MLSEHETLELLEQLKLGVIPGTAGFGGLEIDKVGHWPVLIGGGMCLNLQTVAALEFNTQPEYICVTPFAVESQSCIDLSHRYHQVHHIATGVDGRSLLIAYDQRFSSMLSLLQETDYHSTRECNVAAELIQPAQKDDGSSRQIEFSQAIATSVDPGPLSSGQPVGLSFLELDDEKLTPVAAWRLQLGYCDCESEFFIGLVNSYFINSNAEPPRAKETFSITVRPEKIGRGSGANPLIAELATPELVSFEKIEDCGSFQVNREESVLKRAGREAKDHDTFDELRVQKILQVSVDDLYLLLVEAIGKAATLKFSLDIESLTELAPEHLLREGSTHRCLAVNGLLLREAFLVVSDGKYLLKSHE